MLEGQPGRWFESSFDVPRSKESISGVLAGDGGKSIGPGRFKRGNLFWFRFWGANSLQNRLRTWPVTVELQESMTASITSVVIKDDFGRALVKPEGQPEGSFGDWASGQTVVGEGARRIVAELKETLGTTEPED